MVLVGRPCFCSGYKVRRTFYENLKTVNNNSTFFPKMFPELHWHGFLQLFSFWPYDKWPHANKHDINDISILEAVAIETLNAYDRKVVETLSLRRINVSINCLNLSSGFFTGRWGLRNVKSTKSIWYVGKPVKNKTFSSLSTKAFGHRKWTTVQHQSSTECFQF